MKRNKRQQLFLNGFAATFHLKKQLFFRKQMFDLSFLAAVIQRIDRLLTAPRLSALMQFPCHSLL